MREQPEGAVRGWRRASNRKRGRGASKRTVGHAGITDTRRVEQFGERRARNSREREQVGAGEGRRRIRSKGRV
jgi:hypothetical protein